MSSPNIDLSDITNPSAYHCRVWSYLASHSQLLVRVHKGDFVTGDTFYLLFAEVLYFDGPMSWQGVTFHLGTSEECWELVRKRPGFSEIPQEERLLALKKVRLYTFEAQDCTVRILAGNVHRNKDFPSDFFWLVER